MGKTIIQTIGPLYGEVVNGTVFGRPNGSIYVPITNTIVADLAEAYRYIRNASASQISVCNSSGSMPTGQTRYQIKAVAESQDLANYIGLELATDSEFSNIIGTRSLTAGAFNIATRVVNSDTAIVNETTYYLRAVLYASSGVPVATSSAIEVVGWAE